MKKKDQNRKRNYLHKMCCYILHISSVLKLDFWNEKRQSHKLHVVDKKKLFIVTMAANLNLDENLTLLLAIIQGQIILFFHYLRWF